MADTPTTIRMTRELWARRFLEGLAGERVPVTQDNMDAVVAWIMAEGTRAANNPLATTQPGPAGTSDFNSVGVKSYPTAQAGIHASLTTIRNGRYGAILEAMRRGNTAAGVTRAIDASPWGTKLASATLLRVRADRASAYSGELTGPSEPELDASSGGTIGIPNPVAGALDAAQAAAKLAGALLNPALWQRVAFAIVGGALGALGLVYMIREVR